MMQHKGLQNLIKKMLPNKNVYKLIGPYLKIHVETVTKNLLSLRNTTLLFRPYLKWAFKEEMQSNQTESI